MRQTEIKVDVIARNKAAQRMPGRLVVIAPDGTVSIRESK